MDTTNYTPEQLEGLRRAFHTLNHFMVFMWKLGLGPLINIWPAVIGRIMVIQHRGRKSGRQYLTPVNYAQVDGEVYCTAGFGPRTDWYRNIMAAPDVSIWLPKGWRHARAPLTAPTPPSECDFSGRSSSPPGLPGRFSVWINASTPTDNWQG